MGYLRSLAPPAEIEERYGITRPEGDHSMTFSFSCGASPWLALAFEKCGFNQLALDAAEYVCRDDSTRGGCNKGSLQSMAYSCTGRVLARLGRASESAVAFQLALKTARAAELRLFELLALRDLATNVETCNFV